MSEANKRQVAGEHYKATFQHWDWINALELSYLPATVTKYLTRWKKKNKLEDLEKAAHYLQKFYEVELLKHEYQKDVTNKFIDDNEIQIDEADVVWALFDYNLGNLGKLEVAIKVLARIIEEVKETL